jgi:alkyl hydroperoxide reductase subunit F
MLDQELLNDVAEYFKRLVKPVVFLLDESEHREQASLEELLTQLLTTSPLLKLQRSGQSHPYPHFKIQLENKVTGVSFTGVPGGHEFSSLIMAILHSQQKAKSWDDGLQMQVKNLKGPINLKTYVSLSCENCPEVVQALNHMAFLHPDFSHEMIVGDLMPEEMKRLGVQAVPAVFQQEDLIFAGKQSLVEILEKLKNHLGESNSLEQPSSVSRTYTTDVAVIGGGPAGVSSAVYAARKGQKVLLIAEKIGGQLNDTRGIENFISVRYTEGAKLTAKLQEHMQAYALQVLEHRKVEQIMQKDQSHLLKLSSGEEIIAKAVIIASGAKWRKLNIPGEKDYQGRGVAYCPHCDGPLYKGKKVIVAGGGNSGAEAALDLAQICEHVTLIEYANELKADFIFQQKLKDHPRISILTHTQMLEIRGDGERVQEVVTQNRQTQEFMTLNVDGVFVQIGLIPHSQFLSNYVEKNQFGEIVIDEKCRTSRPGVYAAGDVTTVPYKQIMISMGEGAKAALSAFQDVMTSERIID